MPVERRAGLQRMENERESEDWRIGIKGEGFKNTEGSDWRGIEHFEYCIYPGRKKIGIEFYTWEVQENKFLE